jgi:hypothetical protein
MEKETAGSESHEGDRMEAAALFERGTREFGVAGSESHEEDRMEAAALFERGTREFAAAGIGSSSWLKRFITQQAIALPAFNSHPHPGNRIKKVPFGGCAVK